MINVEMLKESYGEVCQMYAEAFCEMYGYYMRDCWWVANEKGGVFCINDLEFSLGMDDLTYAVNNQVPAEDFYLWWEYVSSDDCFDPLSLRQWCKFQERRKIDE